MEYTDLLPSLALTVVFVCIFPLGEKAWLKTDTFLSTAFALTGIFAPGAFLQRQVTGDLDKVHKHLYRMFGITLLTTSLFSYFTKNSKDPAVKSTVLWGRVIALSLYVLSRCHSYFNISTGVKWNEKALYFGIYGDCLWLLGNLIYAVRCSSYGGAKEITHSRLDKYLLIDFIQVFLFALSFYVFPGLMLGFQARSKLDKMHASIARSMAAFLFGSTFIAGTASRFTDDNDKLLHLLTRLLGNAGYLTAQMFAQLTTNSWTQWHIYFGMVGMSVWSMNAALGYKYGMKRLEKKD